jgi:hypothetical protein
MIPQAMPIITAQENPLDMSIIAAIKTSLFMPITIAWTALAISIVMHF